MATAEEQYLKTTRRNNWRDWRDILILIATAVLLTWGRVELFNGPNADPLPWVLGNLAEDVPIFLAGVIAARHMPRKE